MVKLIMAAALALGGFTGMPGATMAAPVASHNEITAYTPDEIIQYGRANIGATGAQVMAAWAIPAMAMAVATTGRRRMLALMAGATITDTEAFSARADRGNARAPTRLENGRMS